MYAAEMVNQCPLTSWFTNSEVVVAKSMKPVRAFVESKQVAPPWSTTRSNLHSGKGKAFGRVAIYALGDGVPIHGKIKDCSAKRALHEATRKKSGNTTVNFTIHYSDSGFWGHGSSTRLRLSTFLLLIHFLGTGIRPR